MPDSNGSTVKITINVVDANSGQVIATTTKNLNMLGEAGRAAGEKVAAGAARGTASLNELGAAGARVANVGAPALRWTQQLGEAGAKVGSVGAPALRWTQQMGSHSATALDKVRLLSQEFGLRLPRALESMLARMPGVTAAIGSMTGAIAGLAGGEVVVHLGEALYGLEQKFISIKAPADAFYETLKKTSQLDFSNTKSLETTGLRLGQAERGSAVLPQIAASQQRTGFGQLLSGNVYGLANVFGARSLAEGGATSAGQTVELTKQQLDQQHQQQLEQIELNHALDGTLSKRAQISAEMKKQHEIDTENRTYNRKTEMQLGNPAPGNAGASEQRIADQKADAAAAQKTIELNNEVSAAIMRARDAATQAGLQGEALYQEKERAAIRELTAELRAQHMEEESGARVQALKLQYRNEELVRVRELTEATRKQTEEAQNAGLKGMARLDAERRAALANIDQTQKNWTVNGQVDPRAMAQLNQQRTNARTVDTQRSSELAEGFGDRIAEMDASRAASGQSANERIVADTKRTVLEIQKAWREVYDGLEANDPRRVAGQVALNSEILKIQQDGARQQAQVREQLQLETEKMEAEGGRRGMTREQQEAQAILDEYNERYRQIEGLRARDAANSDLYRRQEIAAEEIKNGKIIDLQRQMRDKLAGTLRSLINNPASELKRLGEEQAAKYAATLIMQHTRIGSGAQMPDAGLAGMLGLPLPGRKNNTDQQHTVATNSNVTAASTTMNAATAVINVQSATFGGMNAGAAGARVSPAVFNPGNAGAFGSLPGASVSGVPGAFGGWSGTMGSAPAGSIGGDSGNGFTGMAGVSGYSAPGMTSTGGDAISKISGGLQSGMSMTQDLASLGKTLGMGNSGSGLGKLVGVDGKGGMLGMSSATLGKIGGAAGGAMGLFSAIQGNGGFGGALGGAMSGAQLGAMFGGPIGAGIGAAAGAIIGFIGIGGANKADEYWNKMVKPRIGNDITAFGVGQMDYQSAYDDLVKLDKEAREQTKQFGQGGKREWDGHIHPQIIAAQHQLTREQKAGRSQYGMTAAQFHGGGQINDFGSFATGANEGWIHAQRGETVMHTSATQMHGDALGLMLAGADRGQMAAFYGGNTMQPAANNNPTELHFHAPDARGVYDLLMENKHHVRAALNSSYAENSGGADFA